MIPYTAKQICDLIKGTIVKGNENLSVKNVTIYADTLEPDSVFFMKFSRTSDSLIIKENQPCVVVVNKELSESLLQSDELKDAIITIIKVNSVDNAFWKFVDSYRNRFDIPVIAVTGTSGKTTTKDMIKHILSKYFTVEGTRYSANGRTGHLVYLQRIDNKTDVAVYETAVGAPGDIIYACRHFKPTIGIITNIGIDHIDDCKTVKGYIKAKAEMVDVLNNKGTLILNNDDLNIQGINIENYKGKVLTIGTNKGNKPDFIAEDIKYAKEGMKFILRFNRMRYKVFVPGYGEHQVYNALCAIAGVHELGIGIREAGCRLKSFKKLPRHLELVKGINECDILDDTWNINPTSLRAALNTMKDIAGKRKTIAFIGSAGALGDAENDVALEISSMIIEYNVNVLVVTGSTADLIVNNLIKNGFKGDIYSFKNIKDQTDTIIDVLYNHMDEKSILMAKCSMFDYDFKEVIETIKVKE